MLAMKLGQEIRLELPQDLANKKAAPGCVLRLRFASKEEAARVLNIAHVIGRTRLHLYEAKNAEASFSDEQSLNQSSLHNSSLNLEQTTPTHAEEFEISGHTHPESGRASHHASQLSATHASSTAGQKKSGYGLQAACLEQAMPSPNAVLRGHRAVPDQQQRGTCNTSSAPSYPHQRYQLADGMFQDSNISNSAPWQRDRRQATGLSDPSIVGVKALTAAAAPTEDQSLYPGRDLDRSKVAANPPSITKTHASHLPRPIVTHSYPQAQITSFEENRKLAPNWERGHPQPPGQSFSRRSQGLSSGVPLDSRSRDEQQSFGDEYEAVHTHLTDSQVYTQVDFTSTSRGNINLKTTNSDYSSCELSNFQEVLGVSSQDFRSGDNRLMQGPLRRNPTSALGPQRNEPEALSALQRRPGMDRQGLAPAFISYDGYSSIHPGSQYSQESSQFIDPLQTNPHPRTGHIEPTNNTQQEQTAREKLGFAGVPILGRSIEKENDSGFSELYSEELAFLHPLGIFIEGRKKWTASGEHLDFEPLTTDGTHVRLWDEFAINEPFFISREFSQWNGSSLKKLEDICLGIRIRRNLPAPDSQASIELKLDIISSTESEFNELKKEAAEFRKKLTSLMKSKNTRKNWHEYYPLKCTDAEEMHLGEHATKSSSESRPLSGCRYEEPLIRKLDQQTALNTSELESSSRILLLTAKPDHPSMRLLTSRNVRSPRKTSHNV
jgi:hypothetical protein